MSYSRVICCFLPVICSLVLPSFSRAAPRYEIIAGFDREAHRISGSEIIFFDNTSKVPLTEVYLFLYPNLYLEREPLDQFDLVPKAYPKAFNPGQMTLSTVQDAEGEDLVYLYEKSFAMVRVFLQKPLPPGKRGRLRIAFTSLIPEKSGMFGYIRETTYLQGGWHPYLAPLSDAGWDTDAPLTPSDFEILLTLDSDLAVIASGPSELAASREGKKVLLLKGEKIPFYTLVIHPGHPRNVLVKEQTALSYTYIPGDVKYAAPTLNIVEEVVDYFIERYGTVDLRALQMAEVSLYQDLVSPAEGVLFLSSRLFKVFPYLRRYHEASLARGVLFVLWKKRLAWEAEWVAEGLADRDAQTFLLIKYHGEQSLARLLSPISFIPVIDQILYSRELPLRQVYFKEAVFPPFNEDIRFLWVLRPPGGAIFTKLKNLLGKETLERIVDEYFLRLNRGQRPHFVEVSQKFSQENLGGFYAQWLRSNPVVDFSLEKVEKERLDGNYATTIEIAKKGEGVEPLKIRVREKNGNELILVWDGKGERHQERLITPAPVNLVELDPQLEVNDANRFNNREPHQWKVLLNRLGAGYDFQTSEINYNIEFAFQRVYDERNRITTDFTHDEERNGGGVSYTHVFLNSQAITASLAFEKRRLSATEGSSGIFGLAYQFSYPRVPLAVEYVQRLSGTVPPINIQTSYLQRFTGGDFDRVMQLNMDMKRVFRFSNYHGLGVRAFLGQSLGDLFKGSRYDLGGVDGIRGYTPLAFIGDNMFLLSAEYRFPIFYETGMNLFGLALTRAIQGAIFTDTGMVGGSHNTFQFKKYRADVGASLRFFFDALGFYPAIVRFDVAVPIDSPLPAEREPHWYLSAGQPF
jgi:hypothetical protein